MSTVPDSSVHPPAPAGAVPVYNVPAPGTPKTKRLDYLVVYGHSNLFYWWPVWAVAFVLAALTYVGGQQMAVVPPGSVVVHEANLSGFDGPRTALVAPPGHEFPLAPGAEQEPNGKPKAPASMTVAGNNSLGVIFATTLLVVVVVSTITFRGLVSVLALVFIVAVVLALALLGFWDDIFRFFGGLDIRMNAAGYLFIAIPLFVIWCLVTFVYDRQHYLIFDEGQLRYVREVGESEMVIPSGGVIVERKRADVFRHWLLGFGSGDLQIRFGGSGGQSIELDNVLFIGRKQQLINDFLQKKEVISS